MTEHKDAFMKPIWIITLLTMLFTSTVGIAWHWYALKKAHQKNQQLIDLSLFRTKQYAAYKEVLQKEGKARTLELLNSGKI